MSFACRVRALSLLVAGAVALSGIAGCQRPGPKADSPSINSNDQAPNTAAWPHLRGPRYDGISPETGLAEAWPGDGPPILWTRELGQGYSGFVVAEGKAYTQAQNLSGQYLICLDIETGDEVWRQRIDWPWQSRGAYPGPYATPTWHDGKLYFAAPSGLVGCVDAGSGRNLWSVNVLDRFRGKGAGFGYACTPLIEGGLVILPVGGPGASMVALNAKDGSVVWQTGDEQASYCPALPITWRGRRLIVAYLRNSLALLDSKTGKLHVSRQLSTEYDEHSAWPLYEEPHLFIAAPFRLGAQCFALEAKDDGIALKPKWMSREMSNDVLSSVLHNGAIYGFDLRELQARIHRPSRGEFRCLDFGTGKLRWSSDSVGHASVVVADGKLVLLEETGTLIMARANPEAYEELARHAIFDDGMCWTPTTLWRGRLLVRNHVRAACIYLGNPASLSADQKQRALTAAEIPRTSSWTWLWLIGREPDFPNDAPTIPELSLWYVTCLGIFVIALATLGAMWAFTKLLRRNLSQRLLSWIFWMTVFAFGVLATPAAAHAYDAFVWTWPVSLYAGFHATMLAVTWARHQEPTASVRWGTRLVVLMFLGLGYGYFELCKAVGLAVVWGFLFGFLPAFPFAVWAARAEYDDRGWVQRWVALLLAFSVYFWSSGLLTWWKTNLGGVFQA